MFSIVPPWVRVHPQLRLISGFLASLFIFLHVTAASAAWPSPENAVKTLAPLVGISKDEVEFTLFTLREPACSSTLTSYAAAGDYALPAFASGLKVTNLQSIPGMPSMSAAQCKNYNPTQQAYIFIDKSGDKLLGKPKADFLRKFLGDEIAEGKSQLDNEILAIPYVGPVLANWDCACTFAYTTNFELENQVNSKVALTIGVATAIKAGDYSTALEKMIAGLGPAIACDLADKWSTGLHIPLVSDIASAACTTIIGPAATWVVGAAGTTAEAVGLVGYEHISPDQYYAENFSSLVGKLDYLALSDSLYDKCYKYFEPSNMAASTAASACAQLRSRYIEESVGRIQWDAWSSERNSYFAKNMQTAAQGAALETDLAFEKTKLEVVAVCKTYFAQKYPKANIYLGSLGKERIEDDCDARDAQLNKARAQAQLSLTIAVASRNQPFCGGNGASNSRNSVECTKEGLESCSLELPGVCTASKNGDGFERPCCRLNSKAGLLHEVDKANIANAEQAQAPYCTSDPKNPYRLVCSLPQAYQACLNPKGMTARSSCDKTEKSANGAATELCCSLDESRLGSVPGVNQVRDFLAQMDKTSKGACVQGGMSGPYDPRIARCAGGQAAQACQAALGNKACATQANGYAAQACCQADAFAAVAEEQPDYDPGKRSAADLALTAKVVTDSLGACYYGKTSATQTGSLIGSQEDRFKVVCDSISAAQACVETVGRTAQSSCQLQGGWASAPCCERSSKAMGGNASVGQPAASGVSAVGIRPVGGGGNLGAPAATSSKPGLGGRISGMGRATSPSGGLAPVAPATPGSPGLRAPAALPANRPGDLRRNAGVPASPSAVPATPVAPDRAEASGQGAVPPAAVGDEGRNRGAGSAAVPQARPGAEPGGRMPRLATPDNSGR